MLHVVCIRAGEAFSADYVVNLKDMVTRNVEAGFPGRFVCFTDRPDELPSDIETSPLPADLPGWWSKLALFRDGLFPEGDRILFFDLDTLITGPIDKLVAYDGDFAILRDFYRPTGLQSSVMAWEAGEQTEIWESFERAGCPMDNPGGDQAWIELVGCQGWMRRWQSIFPGMFVSYKQTKGIPSEASVVVFHGKPRPHEVTEGWVPKVWCQGGISHAELKAVCNTAQEALLDNVRSACARDLKWFAPWDEHDRHVAIIGGAPSVVDMLDEVGWRQSQGQQIWALNNAAKICLNYGIRVDAQVLLDARPENKMFLRTAGEYLIASQCDPEVFESFSQPLTGVARMPITLWHVNGPGMADLLRDEKDRLAYLVGGGTTVGLNAIALAFTRGYRQIHLYGFDSCYRNGEHHAYAQPLNDSERVSEVLYNNKTYVCAPWMVGQAQEFIELLPGYVNDGCTITVHGSGLLQDIALDMMSDHGTETKIVNGLMWPRDDFECAAAVFDTAALEAVYPHCDDFGVCIQAGGNCGVWPRALAEKFKTVYTFEPDPLNFQCLSHNAPGGNIIKFNAALGNDHELIDLDRSHRNNCGAFQIVKGGDIPTHRIDDLGLKECGLIYLDIEGFEFEAIKGGIETVRKFHPVIAFEDKGLSERYGTSQGHLEKWLSENLEYRVAERVGRDVIMTSTHRR